MDNYLMYNTCPKCGREGGKGHYPRTGKPVFKSYLTFTQCVGIDKQLPFSEPKLPMTWGG